MNRAVRKHLPSNVGRFEQLMYLSLGLSLIDTPLEWSHLVAETGAGFAVFGTLFAYGFAVLLIWQAAREHKNWARWVLLILFAVSLVGTLRHSTPSAGLLAWILLSGEFLTWGAALFLIFNGNARSWFEPSVTCSKCGAIQYSQGSAFCTRCGASLNSPPYYNAPRARSGWQSLPFFVRLTIYALCVPILIGVFIWISVLATVLSLFRP